MLIADWNALVVKFSVTDFADLTFIWEITSLTVRDETWDTESVEKSMTWFTLSTLSWLLTDEAVRVTDGNTFAVL